MFLLLMKTRLLGARNLVCDTLRRKPLRAAGLTVLGGCLFTGVFFGFLLLFRFARALDVLSETLYQVFYFLFLFLLAGSVPFIASTLLQSSDYSLLFSAPVPARTVVAAKLLEATVANALQFTVLGIPAIVAAAVAVSLPPLAWLAVPLLVALFVLLPALITALGLLLALAAVGIRRLRGAITLLNGAMAVTVCITVMLEAGHLPLRSAALAGALPALRAPPSVGAHRAPSAWFVEVLVSLGAEKFDMGAAAVLAGKTVLLIAVLYAACMALGGRLLSTAGIAAESEEDAGRPIQRSARRSGRAAPVGPFAALLAKDLRYLLRDNLLVSQLAMPVALMAIPFLIAMRSPAALRAEMGPFSSAVVGVIVFMQTSILSLSSIGLESRSFWIVLASPTAMTRLLWAKFVLCTLVSAGVGIVLTLLSAAGFGFSAATALAQCTLLTLCSAGLCGLGVGISAALPRFAYENPAHRVSAWGLILGFFATTGYLTVCSVIFGLAWLLALQPEFEGRAPLLFGIAIALYLGLTACVVFVPIAAGAHRLERYPWEH